MIGIGIPMTQARMPFIESLQNCFACLANASGGRPVPRCGWGPRQIPQSGYPAGIIRQYQRAVSPHVPGLAQLVMADFRSRRAASRVARQRRIVVSWPGMMAARRGRKVVLPGSLSTPVSLNLRIRKAGRRGSARARTVAPPAQQCGANVAFSADRAGWRQDAPEKAPGDRHGPGPLASRC